MSENLSIGHLRAIRAEISSIKDEVRDVKHRLTSLEVTVSGLQRDQAASAEAAADQRTQIERLGARLDRLERRLDSKGT